MSSSEKHLLNTRQSCASKEKVLPHQGRFSPLHVLLSSFKNLLKGTELIRTVGQITKLFLSCFSQKQARHSKFQGKCLKLGKLTNNQKLALIIENMKQFLLIHLTQEALPDLYTLGSQNQLCLKSITQVQKPYSLLINTIIMVAGQLLFGIYELCEVFT